MSKTKEIFILQKEVLSKKILVSIFNDMYFENNFIDEKIHFFGFPIFENLSKVSTDNIHKYREDISGYYLRISEVNNQLIISNDIIGNFRLYYYMDNNKIIISDKYQFILEQLDEKQLLLNNEYEYYKKHRYCMGDKTFIDSIKKLSPCSTLMINERLELKIKNDFKTIDNFPNRKEHSRLFMNELLHSVKQLKIFKEKKLLFFSGGYDSLLLVGLLIKLEIDFIPIFIKANPFYEANFNDYNKALNSAKELNLDLKILEVNINKVDEQLEDDISNEMLFDMHFSLLHFMGMQEIRKIYGRDVIIINGQGSDSILSFGPSEKQISSFLKRFVLYYPYNIITKIVSKIVNSKINMDLSINKETNEYYISFLDEKNYWFLKDTQLKKEYKIFLSEKINSLLLEKDDWKYSFLMYLKIFGFLQGSDNQVVIKSANFVGISKVYLPFSNPKIIYDTIKYKNNLQELLNPKYVVSDSLKELNIKYIKKTTRYKKIKFINIEKVENKVALFLKTKLEELLK